jgi:endothelin-converting enzyme
MCTIQTKYTNADTVKHSIFSPAQLLQTESSIDKQNFQKLKTAYDACIDEEAIKAEGIKPLMDILEMVAALFPAKKLNGDAENKPKSDEALSNALTFLNKLGISPLVSIGPGADDKDPDTVVIQVSPPWRIGLPAKDYYENKKVVQQYTETLEQLCDNFNVHEAVFSKNSNCTELSQNLVHFEKQLAAASPDPEDLSDVTVSIISQVLIVADRA